MPHHQGDLYNHESLVVAMESADVVISAVGYAQLLDQTRIISAIKDAGNIKVTYCTSMENVICVYLLVCCGHFNVTIMYICLFRRLPTPRRKNESSEMQAN